MGIPTMEKELRSVSLTAPPCFGNLLRGDGLVQESDGRDFYDHSHNRLRSSDIQNLRENPDSTESTS